MSSSNAKKPRPVDRKRKAYAIVPLSRSRDLPMRHNNYQSAMETRPIKSDPDSTNTTPPISSTAESGLRTADSRRRIRHESITLRLPRARQGNRDDMESTSL